MAVSKPPTKSTTKVKLDPYLAYELYEASVQNPEADIEFINREYKRIHGVKPLSLREDFGGTGLLCCNWVKQSKEHTSFAIDLDPTPMNFGRERHHSLLKNDEKLRVEYLQDNVLKPKKFKTDVVVAFNFSYFIFKSRDLMLEYFKMVRQGMNKKGVFLLDIFGGTEAYQPLEEETKHKTHTYYWDCDSYNPITNEVNYFIHFKYQGIKFLRVFSYDWRMWSIREIEDILREAGFSDVLIYWEGDDGKGGGDGVFKATRKSTTCSSWISYIAAIS